ncbi:MAG: hypothetical protein JXR51_12960 [Bacteroidales bacterium]|nr:hypothetical protein [Bacteroidales bacterium]MBN2758080.1 hypothetical protein [Bacteroidales bacterium]
MKEVALEKDYNSDYWENKYLNNKTGWDIGYIATPIKEYFDQIEEKSVKILVPGAGNGYEVEYLFNNGFKNVFFLDYSDFATQNFKKRIPSFPDNQIINENFFSHKGNYNIIVELAFFSSIKREIRKNYASKMHDLLSEKGKLIGLLFNHEFENDFPPFGGTAKEYKNLFSPYFNIKSMEIAYNSIKPRANRELFLHLIKKQI